LTWAFEFEDQPYFAGFRVLASNGIDLPVLNVFRMFSRMNGQRVATTSSGEVPLESILRDGVRGAADVAALAGRDAKKLTVMIWHYHDDDVTGPGASVGLALENLPLASGSARMTHFRIDESHSNAFAEWKRLGSPIAPNEKQYEQMQQAGQLASVGAQETIRIEQGRAVIKAHLPRQAVSLFVIEWD